MISSLLWFSPTPKLGHGSSPFSSLPTFLLEFKHYHKQEEQCMYYLFKRKQSYQLCKFLLFFFYYLLIKISFFFLLQNSIFVKSGKMVLFFFYFFNQISFFFSLSLVILINFFFCKTETSKMIAIVHNARWKFPWCEWMVYKKESRHMSEILFNMHQILFSVVTKCQVS